MVGDPFPLFGGEVGQRSADLRLVAEGEDRGDPVRRVGEAEAGVLPGAPGEVDVEDAAEGLQVGPAAGRGDGDEVVDQPSFGDELRVEHGGPEEGED